MAEIERREDTSLEMGNAIQSYCAFTQVHVASDMLYDIHAVNFLE